MTDHPKLSIDTPIKWVEVGSLKENPKNPNKHPEDQIERLAEIIRYQGFRHPIIVSNQSGFIVVGHGRLMAAKKLALTKVPVQFQDFESPEQEYAFVVSDNAVAGWADLDLSLINLELENLGPDFDIDLLGLKDFTLDVSDKIEETGFPDISANSDAPELSNITFILHNDQLEELQQALKVAKEMGEFGDTGNQNSNGNALARIVETFLTQNG
jgi:hypothetical protein